MVASSAAPHPSGSLWSTTSVAEVGDQARASLAAWTPSVRLGADRPSRTRIATKATGHDDASADDKADENVDERTVEERAVDERDRSAAPRPGRRGGVVRLSATASAAGMRRR